MKIGHALRQTGFAAPLILSLVLIVALAAGSLLVWQRNQTAPAQLSSTPTITPAITPIPSPTSISQPSPSLNPTTDWKTYTNSQYKFSIKYPKEWSLREIPRGNNSTELEEIQFLPKGSEPKPYTPGSSLYVIGTSVLALVYNNTNNLNAEAFIKKTTGEIYQYNAYSLGDQTGTRFSVTKTMTPSENIVVTKDKRVYWLKLYLPSEDIISTSLFNQILSTFKFLD